MDLKIGLLKKISPYLIHLCDHIVRLIRYQSLIKSGRISLAEN